MVKTKRRAGVRRYPSGQIHHADRKPAETEQQIKAVVIAYRAKNNPDIDPASQYAGYELGRLFLREIIDERQRDAGERWARLVTRFARTMGYPVPTPKSVEMEEGRGVSCAPEPDPDRIMALRRDYADAFAMLSDAGRAAQVACKAVCCQEADTRNWPPHTVKAMKAGLDRLAVFFGI